MTDDRREEWLEERQDARVYPLGRALRATYDADNHDSLGSDVTKLMIDLSRIPYGSGAAAPRPAHGPAPAALPAHSALRPSILARIGGMFGRR